MFVEERHQEILRLLEENEKVKVKDLSKRFEVTEDCIRKDLASMEVKNLLKRTYGGAVRPDTLHPGHNNIVSTRKDKNIKEKQQIAKKAVELIRNGDMIFLDTSTTNIELAKEIIKRELQITVVSCMLDIAELFTTTKNVNFILLGGQFNRSQNGFLGELTRQMMENFRFDICFMGVVGADLFAAITASHLALPLGVIGFIVGGLLLLQQAAAQNFQCLLFVFALAALVLALHHHTGGQVGHPDGGRRFVDVLAACAGGAEGINAQVLGVQFQLHFLGFRHDGNGGGGSVDAALGLGFRHALHPVAAGLELELAVSAIARHADNGLFIAAQLGVAGRDDLDAPALALGVAAVHAEQIAGKQRRFVTAGTGAHFHESVTLVIGIFRLRIHYQPVLFVIEPVYIKLINQTQIRF